MYKENADYTGSKNRVNPHFFSNPVPVFSGTPPLLGHDLPLYQPKTKIHERPDNRCHKPTTIRRYIQLLSLTG